MTTVIPNAECVSPEELDAAGFLPGCGESEADFRARVARTRQVAGELRSVLASSGEIECFGLRLPASDLIDDSMIVEGADITEQLYGFRVTHIPGFFLSRGVGLLWGGCMIADPEQSLAVFLIRRAFKNRRRWWIYRREELLSHELCHSMRQSLGETTLEEYFAYRTSRSRLRRYLGNCFIRERDALIFALPTLLAPLGSLLQLMWLPQLWLWPFWLAAVSGPGWLLWRNAVSRRIVEQAHRRLTKFQVAEPWPVLFRCTRAELIDLGRLGTIGEFNRFCAEKSGSELRWSIICRRFIDKNRENSGSAG